MIYYFYCGDTTKHGKKNAFRTCTEMCMGRIDRGVCKKSCQTFQDALLKETILNKEAENDKRKTTPQIYYWQLEKGKR